MNITRLSLIAATLLGTALPAQAQTTALLTPTALPLVPIQSQTVGQTEAPEQIVMKAPPKPGAWTVAFTYLDGSASVDPTGRLSSVTVSAVGNLTHLTFNHIGGAFREIWEAGPNDYGKDSTSPQWAYVFAPAETTRFIPKPPAPGEIPALSDPAETEPSFTDEQHFLQNKFPGIEWITSACTVVYAKYQDTDSIIYFKTAPDGDMNDPDALKQAIDSADYVAILSARTHFPLEIHGPCVKEVFSYTTAPSTLVFPQILELKSPQGARDRAVLNQRAARPF